VLGDSEGHIANCTGGALLIVGQRPEDRAAPGGIDVVTDGTVDALVAMT